MVDEPAFGVEESLEHIAHHHPGDKIREKHTGLHDLDILVHPNFVDEDSEKDGAQGTYQHEQKVENHRIAGYPPSPGGVEEKHEVLKPYKGTQNTLAEIELFKGYDNIGEGQIPIEQGVDHGGQHQKIQEFVSPEFLAKAHLFFLIPADSFFFENGS
jgi:hypothetical protein